MAGEPHGFSNEASYYIDEIQIDPFHLDSQWQNRVPKIRFGWLAKLLKTLIDVKWLVLGPDHFVLPALFFRGVHQKAELIRQTGGRCLAPWERPAAEASRGNLSNPKSFLMMAG